MAVMPTWFNDALANLRPSPAQPISVPAHLRDLWSADVKRKMYRSLINVVFGVEKPKVTDEDWKAWAVDLTGCEDATVVRSVDGVQVRWPMAPGNIMAVSLDFRMDG